MRCNLLQNEWLTLGLTDRCMGLSSPEQTQAYSYKYMRKSTLHTQRILYEEKKMTGLSEKVPECLQCIYCRAEDLKDEKVLDISKAMKTFNQNQSGSLL